LENKDEFNLLIAKTSNNLLELYRIFGSEDDMKATLDKYMRDNYKVCHSKFRA
jgi:hypothetical protein